MQSGLQELFNGGECFINMSYGVGVDLKRDVTVALREKENHWSRKKKIAYRFNEDFEMLCYTQKLTGNILLPLLNTKTGTFTLKSIE